MSRFTMGLALAAGLLVVLLLSAPARLLGFLVPADVLVMQGFSGTLWRGTAARCLLAVGHGYLHLGSVKWRLAPLSLLTLSPTVELQSRWGSQDVATKITLRSERDFDLEDFDAVLPAQLLRQFFPLMVEGSFAMQLPRMIIREGLPYAGEGRVMWRNAAWSSPQGSLPLGSYALDFKQQPDAALIGEIVTVAGPVNVTGTLEQQARRYDVDILLAAEAGLDADLEQAVSLMAQPVEGGYRLQLNGEF